MCSGSSDGGSTSWCERPKPRHTSFGPLTANVDLRKVQKDTSLWLLASLTLGPKQSWTDFGQIWNTCGSVGESLTRSPQRVRLEASVQVSADSTQSQLQLLRYCPEKCLHFTRSLCAKGVRSGDDEQVGQRKAFSRICVGSSATHRTWTSKIPRSPRSAGEVSRPLLKLTCRFVWMQVNSIPEWSFFQK